MPIMAEPHNKKSALMLLGTREKARRGGAEPIGHCEYTLAFPSLVGSLPLAKTHIQYGKL